jgi:hypothetical protein
VAYYIMVDSEQMQVTAGFGTATWTVVRGTNGTTAATHSITATVYQCASALLPIEPTWFEPMVDRYSPELMRNSFEKHYESQIVGTHAELKGVKVPVSYETLVQLLLYSVKGGVTPTTTDSHAYTWNFAPTLTSDDLAGMGAEMGNDTAAYHLAALYADQLVIEIARGSTSAQATVDFLGQSALAMGAKTPGLTRTGLNLANPANTQTYLDGTTIGSTAANDMTSVKATIKNGFQQLYFLNGQLSPTGAVRPTRNLDLELVQWFDSATEVAAAMATTSNTGTERKIRVTTTAPAGSIASSSSPLSFNIDAYGYWNKLAFKVDKDVWHVTYTMQSVYDVSAGNSWSMSVTNGISVAP